PIIQQVTEPARQAVSTLANSDVLTAIGPALPVVMPRPVVPTPTPFVASLTLDIQIEDAPEAAVEEQPPVIAAPTTVVAYRPLPITLAPAPAQPAPIDE